jgi:hypothetical protein
LHPVAINLREEGMEPEEKVTMTTISEGKHVRR